MQTDLVLSIVATTLAVASFGGQAWRIWRDRPRLTVFVTPITFTNVPRIGEMKMLQVMICNIGYRPIVLTRFIGVGNSSSFDMGIDDEPAAVLGRQDQRFPTLLEPGKTLKIHPIGFEELKRNQTDPEDPKVHFDPFRYFIVLDSFGRMHPLDVQDVLGALHLQTHRKSRVHIKLVHVIRQKLFLRRARKWIRH